MKQHEENGVIIHMQQVVIDIKIQHEIINIVEMYEIEFI